MNEREWWWAEGRSDPADDCPCMVCVGRRQWTRYERTGIEPIWKLVAVWRAREAWLANATVTTRRRLAGER